MLRSMTGFGSYKGQNEKYLINIEIKSLNSKYLDIKIKLPRYLSYLEPNIRDLISAYISRAYVQVNIEVENLSSDLNDFSVNYKLLDSYREKLSDISSYLGLEKSFDVLDLLTYDQEIFQKTDIDLGQDQEFLVFLDQACKEACENLLEMRVSEGYNIKTDLKEKLDLMEKILGFIEELSKSQISSLDDQVRDKIKPLLDQAGMTLDENKLYNEIIFLSDRLTIDEEVTRLKSHIKLMLQSLDMEESPLGKKLDFICQEMNREANTIGSKTSDIDIKNLIIELKTLIENIREQVQNIE